MDIDRSQPIMFDSDTMPGLGAGYWQVHRFMDDDHRKQRPIPTDWASRIARFVVALLLVSIVISGAIKSFLL
jgi:hypothetical protein